jgi:hypothetical protein
MTYPPIDLDALRTFPIAGRRSKVRHTDFAKPWTPGGSFSNFLDALPAILAGGDLRAIIEAIGSAVQEKRPVVFAMGAHVIKVGLSPLIIDLMQNHVITAVALNGAGIIHDAELAMTGQTSEDVAATLGNGTFGMARETATFVARAIERACRENIGLGAAVGGQILAENLPFAEKSLLAKGAQLDIPVTVHVAMGTDIVHMHPNFDPAAAGAASHLDFRILAAVIADLQDGVYLNVGSAVILPEVFLKAVTLVRNLGHRLTRFTTVNLDFIRHYRPMTNVVTRPTAHGGSGYNLVGHHEILIPLIAAGVCEHLACQKKVDPNANI